MTLYIQRIQSRVQPSEIDKVHSFNMENETKDTRCDPMFEFHAPMRAGRDDVAAGLHNTSVNDTDITVGKLEDIPNTVNTPSDGNEVESKTAASNDNATSDKVEDEMKPESMQHNVQSGESKVDGNITARNNNAPSDKVEVKTKPNYKKNENENVVTETEKSCDLSNHKEANKAEHARLVESEVAHTGKELDNLKLSQGLNDQADIDLPVQQRTHLEQDLYKKGGGQYEVQGTPDLSEGPSVTMVKHATKVDTSNAKVINETVPDIEDDVTDDATDKEAFDSSKIDKCDTVNSISALEDKSFTDSNDVDQIPYMDEVDGAGDQHVGITEPAQESNNTTKGETKTASPEQEEALEKADEQLDEKADEKADEKTDERLDEKADEKEDEQFDEKADEHLHEKADEKADKDEDKKVISSFEFLSEYA